MRRAVVTWMLLLGACTKTDPPKPDAGAPVVSLSAAVAAASATADAGRDGAVSALDLTGTYTAKASIPYMPEGKDWAGLKFKGDEAGAGLGEGTITLHIDDEGRVSGSLDGPLGPAEIYGTATADRVTATVRLDLDADKGWIGTLAAARTADKIEGTIQISSPTANVVRIAEVSAKKK